MLAIQAIRRRQFPARQVVHLRGGRWSDYLFAVPAVLFVGLVIVGPLGYTISLSLHRVNLGNLLGGQAPFVGFQNFTAAFTSGALWHSLAISLTYTGGSIVVAFVLGFALAVFFAQGFPGSGTMRAVLLVCWMLPTVVTGTVWRWMLQGEGGIVNTVLHALGMIDGPIFWLSDSDTALVAVIIATVWVLTPFAMILLLAGLQGIPSSLYEAAKVDGANYWQRLVHITVPMMRPVSLTVVLLSFIFTFKTFDNVYVMTRGGPGEATEILPIRAYNLAFQFFRFSEGATVTLVLLVISLLLAAVYSWLIRQERV